MKFEIKCNVLVISSHKKANMITQAGQNVVLRLLELFINNKLLYETHTNVVCSRLNGKLIAQDGLRGKASFRP